MAELQRHEVIIRRLIPWISFRNGALPVTLDLALIDGNHDFEFALFDLQMTARLFLALVVLSSWIMQSRPALSGGAFVERHPAWRELGSAISDNSNIPLMTRASPPLTTFVVLQAPLCVSIGRGSHSCSNVATSALRRRSGAGHADEAYRRRSPLSRLRTRLRRRATDGIQEMQTSGAIRSRRKARCRIAFLRAAGLDPPSPPCPAVHNVEIDSSWKPTRAPLPRLVSCAGPARIVRKAKGRIPQAITSISKVCGSIGCP